MNNYDVLEYKYVQFIEALQRVEAKSVQYHTLFSKRNYVTSYNDCFNVADFNRHLNDLYKAFKYELQHLPLNYPSKDARRVFLINLHLTLLEARSEVQEKFKTEVQPKYKYLYLGKDVALKKFPDRFNKLLYDTKKDYEHHKIHFIYHIQYRTINRAIDLVIFFANNEGIDLTNHVKEQKNIKQVQKPRIKTCLTLAQLSHFINLVSEAIGGAISKSELAKFISDTFETSRSKKPSTRQVYKGFYDVGESTKEGVKDLVIEMLNKVRN